MNAKIDKILRCKINENGERYYEVEWEKCWVKADCLSSYQTLIYKFWHFVELNHSIKPAELISEHLNGSSLLCPANSDAIQSSQSSTDNSNLHRVIKQEPVEESFGFSIDSSKIYDNFISDSLSENQSNNRVNNLGKEVVGSRISPQHKDCKLSDRTINNIHSTDKEVSGKTENTVLEKLTSVAGRNSSSLANKYYTACHTSNKYKSSVTTTRSPQKEVGTATNARNLPDWRSVMKKVDGTATDFPDWSSKMTKVELWKDGVLFGHKFKCTICNETYTQKAGFKRHFERHTGEKRSACALCGKEFYREFNCKRHVRSCGKRNITQMKQFLVDNPPMECDPTEQHESIKSESTKII